MIITQEGVTEVQKMCHPPDEDYRYRMLMEIEFINPQTVKT
jgi:hypothetical protein